MTRVTNAEGSLKPMSFEFPATVLCVTRTRNWDLETISARSQKEVHAEIGKDQGERGCQRDLSCS